MYKVRKIAGAGVHCLGIGIVPYLAHTRTSPQVAILNLLGLGQTVWA